MTEDDWKALARKRLESGKMTDDEWDECLCVLSDFASGGISLFADAIQDAQDFEDSVTAAYEEFERDNPVNPIK